MAMPNEPFYPRLLNLFNQPAIENTVTAEITGDQVHSTEDLPRRLIAGSSIQKAFTTVKQRGKRIGRPLGRVGAISCDSK